MPVLNLLTSQKSAFFAPRRLVPPIQVKIDMAEGAVGSHGRTKYRANRSTGVGRRPPKIENFHIMLTSRPPGGGEPFDRFLQLLRAFIRPTIPLINRRIKALNFVFYI